MLSLAPTAEEICEALVATSSTSGERVKLSLLGPATAALVAAVLAAGCGDASAGGSLASPAKAATAAPTSRGGSGDGKTVVALAADFPPPPPGTTPRTSRT